MYPLSNADKVCFRWPLAVEFNPLRWDVTGSRVKGREHNARTRLLLCWRDENIHHLISVLPLSWPQTSQSAFNVYLGIASTSALMNGAKLSTSRCYHFDCNASRSLCLGMIIWLQINNNIKILVVVVVVFYVPFLLFIINVYSNFTK